MSTIVYGSGFVELYGTLMNLPVMAVDSWLDNYGGTIRFLVETRQQNYLAGYIYQQATERCGEKSSIQYFYLMDKLMRTRKSFVPTFQSILIDLYTMVFVTFWQRGFHGSIEELKILRKLWLGTVSFPVLHSIRLRIMELLAIDIEAGFRRQTIENIERYYRNVLKMDERQIRQHLPAVTQGELQARYDELNYQPTNILTPARNQEVEGKRRRDYLFQEDKKPRKVRVVEEDGARRPVTATKPEPVANEPRPQPIQKPQKQPEISISREDAALAKLRILRGLGRFRCQKCGVCFGEQRAYDQHLSFHFQQNLQRYDMKVRRVNFAQRASNLSLELWNTHPLQAKHNQETLDRYYIPLKKLDQLGLEHFCDFCGEHFTPRLLESQGTWVYVNCVEVDRESSSARKVILHKNCLDVLQPVQPH